MPAPIGNTCPDINLALGKIQAARGDIKALIKYHCDEKVEERTHDLETIDDYLSEIADMLEDLRKDNETLRKYGQEMEEESETLQVQLDELQEKYNDVVSSESRCVVK